MWPPLGFFFFFGCHAQQHASECLSEQHVVIQKLLVQILRQTHSLAAAHKIAKNRTTKPMKFSTTTATATMMLLAAIAAATTTTTVDAYSFGFPIVRPRRFLVATRPVVQHYRPTAWIVQRDSRLHPVSPPRLDVVDNDETFRVAVDVPGVNASDVQVTNSL